MIDIDKISTRICDLPTSIRSFVHQDETGEYTIFINARFNEIQRMMAYKHELRHIFGNDFEKTENIDTIETNTHKIS